MTYNFDPDKWYDNELLLIQSRLKTGEIKQDEYDKAVEILDKKLEEMWKRLDGSYLINNGNYKRDITKMKTINRTALTIIPKQPYFDWMNSFEAAETYDTPHATTILIPDKYDEFNYETYVKKIFNQIFEEELESWMADPDVWPPKRTYKMFKNWFDVICSDMTWDYGDGDHIRFFKPLFKPKLFYSAKVVHFHVMRVSGCTISSRSKI